MYAYVENLEVKGLEGSLVPRSHSRAGRAPERGCLDIEDNSSICFVYVREKKEKKFIILNSFYTSEKKI